MRLLIAAIIWWLSFDLSAEEACRQGELCEHADESKFTWDIDFSPFEPYFWLANTNADSILAGKNQPIELDFFQNPTENMGDGLQLRIELHLFANKNKWSVIIDPTRIHADSGQDFNNVSIATSSTFKMSDIKVGYLVTDKIDVFMGARYTYQDLRVSSSAFATSIKGSHNWWSPVVGLRYRYDINQEWHFSSGVYLGGLARGSDDDYTSSANFIFTYKYKDWLDFLVGYRALQVRFSTGLGASLFTYDATYSGPLLGVKVDFF